MAASYEREQDKTYTKICATSEDFDQPAHLHRLIKIFTDRVYFYSLQAIHRGTNENPCHTVWM